MFNPDYSDLLRLFTAHNVEYIVVGAYAMAAHGYVRSTGDMDVFVRPTSDNAKAVYSALVEFGAPLSGITVEDFRASGTAYQIGVSPNRIDILTEIDGLSVPFLDTDSLIRNKAANGCFLFDSVDNLVFVAPGKCNSPLAIPDRKQPWVFLQ